MDQQAIDSFSINFPDCKVFRGNLYIYSKEENPTNNLKGLNQLEEIDGSLIIEGNTELKNLDGLENLKSIRYLRINQNIGLSNLKGLVNITSIDYISVYSNLELISLEGLNKLTDVRQISIRNNNNLLDLGTLNELDTIKGDITLENNLQLKNLEGLSSLKKIGGTLAILNNDDLINLQGLENLDSITGILHIQHNDQLTGLTTFQIVKVGGISFNNNPQIVNLVGLENLQVINGNAIFYEMSQFKNFQGLEQLKTIKGKLQIRNNQELVSLRGLNNLHTIGSLVIQEGLPQLEELAGLENLKKILTLLSIDNTNLVSLNAFQQLDTIIGTFDLGENLELKELNGLNNIRFIGNRLFISGDYGQLLNFENLDQIGGQLNISKSSFIPNFPKLITIPSLTIEFNKLLTNLKGLENVKKIDTRLYLNVNDALSSLRGLENIESARNVSIVNNNVLKNLDELEHLTVCPNIAISYNGQLSDLSGLNNVQLITNLEVKYNPNLAVCQSSNICYSIENGNNIKIIGNATGCNTTNQILASCESDDCNINDLVLNSQQAIDSFAIDYPNCSELIGNLIIEETEGAITDLRGLKFLQTVNGNIIIRGNADLSSLEGLENIDFSSLNSLEITQNPNLTKCDLANLCPYLRTIPLKIVGNTKNCEDQFALLEDCINNCISGSILLSTQEEIDNFAITYSACSEIGGNLIIREKNKGNIKDLEGLKNIQQISGFLKIFNNHTLQNLNGLNNLKIIGLDLEIRENPNLKNLKGLDNLQIIQDYLLLSNNNALENLEGIENLMGINGFRGLTIEYNPSLTSLQGIKQIIFNNSCFDLYGNQCLANIEDLKNLDFQKIEIFRIIKCPLITQCATEKICQFIQDGKRFNFSGNGIGCRWNDEVIKQCEIAPILPSNKEEENTPFQLHFFPNPTKGHLFIRSIKITNLPYKVFNITGKLIASGIVQANAIDISSLSSGIYFITIENEEEQLMGKVLKN